MKKKTKSKIKKTSPEHTNTNWPQEPPPGYWDQYWNQTPNPDPSLALRDALIDIAINFDRAGVQRFARKRKKLLTKRAELNKKSSSRGRANINEQLTAIDIALQSLDRRTGFFPNDIALEGRAACKAARAVLKAGGSLVLKAGSTQGDPLGPSDVIVEKIRCAEKLFSKIGVAGRNPAFDLTRYVPEILELEDWFRNIAGKLETRVAIRQSQAWKDSGHAELATLRVGATAISGEAAKKGIGEINPHKETARELAAPNPRDQSTHNDALANHKANVQTQSGQEQQQGADAEKFAPDIAVPLASLPAKTTASDQRLGNHKLSATLKEMMKALKVDDRQLVSRTLFFKFRQDAKVLSGLKGGKAKEHVYSKDDIRKIIAEVEKWNFRHVEDKTKVIQILRDKFC